MFYYLYGALLQLKLKGKAIKLSSSLSHFYMTPSS